MQLSRLIAHIITFATCVAAPGAQAATLYDNLSSTNGGSEVIASDRWLAATFTTDATAYTSLSATLLMSQATAGTAQLDVYSDTGLLQPISYLGTLTAPASFATSSLANATFSSSDLNLAANTTYWLVLHAPTGSYNWGWTSDFESTHGWADSTNSGSTWFTSEIYPPQFSVTGSVVPEPSGVVLGAIALTALAFRRRLTR